MEERQNELSKLRSYIEKTDKELTMILQTLQWDRKQLMKNDEFTQCPYDKNHLIPVSAKEEHEKNCFLLSNGYRKHDKMLPDPVDSESSSFIKFSMGDLSKIFEQATKNDTQFKKGIGHTEGVLPLTLERIQSAYTADERKAIHDAVVAAAPIHGDHLTDLTLPSESRKNDRAKSHLEVLAELRDMKRRRTKYRVAAKTKNYSDVLRDVIKTQMELYTDIKEEKITELSNTTNANYQEERGCKENKREHQTDRRKDPKWRIYEKHNNESEYITRDYRNNDSRENRDKRNKEEFKVKVEKEDYYTRRRNRYSSSRDNRSGTSSTSYRDSSFYNTTKIKEEPQSPSSKPHHYQNSYYKRDNEKRNDKRSDSSYKREDRKRSKDANSSRKYYEHDGRYEEKKRSRREL